MVVMVVVTQGACQNVVLRCCLSEVTEPWLHCARVVNQPEILVPAPQIKSSQIHDL